MLHQKITEDLKTAMKAGKEFKVGVLRFLLSSLHNKEIEKKSKGLEPTLSDEEIIEILSREAKKRKEAIEMYTEGGRNDLVEKEEKELEIIKQYLPEQLSEEEIEKIVVATIEKIGVKDIKALGRVMGEVMKELKGKADASLVSEIVKKRLSL
jgi:uncharacterized protein YqeY